MGCSYASRSSSAGAVGNIIDSAFYGLIFSESAYHDYAPATMFPPEGGYAALPVRASSPSDMLYVP